MIATAANLAWAAAQAGARGRFRRQLAAPDETQRRVLRELLQRNAGSAFGRAHGFAGIRTTEEFSARVPLAAYDDLAPWIARIRRGEAGVLTTDAVTHLIPTSGSSGARKLIPFTRQLQREFDRAIGPWVTDLFARHPAALFGPAYWSVSPALAADTATESPVPVGFEDDTNYLGGIHRWLVSATLAAPSALRHVSDMETFFLLTLACLVRRRDLRLVSVWHPSFFLLLLDALPRHWESICAIIHDGRLPGGLVLPAAVRAALSFAPSPARARELRLIGPDQPQQLWPKLAVISCWTEAHAASAAEILRRKFPQAMLQPKGLLATEAFVTLPFEGAHPLAIGSHYFEFIDDTGAVRTAGDLEAGRVYEVVVSTGGGLWRYRTGDRVRVEGFASRTPSLRFVGRVGRVSDLFGEKLSEEFVATVLRLLSQDQPARFALLAPETDGTTGGYTLYWEGPPPPSVADLESRLGENPHYAWCRQLGQLRAARVVPVAGGTESYLRHAAHPGARLGDLKLPALALSPGWGNCFRPAPIHHSSAPSHK